jgi:hypothetical protein
MVVFFFCGGYGQNLPDMLACSIKKPDKFPGCRAKITNAETRGQALDWKQDPACAYFHGFLFPV